MQVTVDVPLTVIHRCQLLSFAEGETVGGDIAAYLLGSGAAVTPADDDAEALASVKPDKDAAAKAALLDAGITPAVEVADTATVDDDPDDADVAVAPAEIDVAVSTIDQVLDWVNTDPASARAALAAEQGRGDKARTRLMAKLDEIAQG